MFNLHFNGFHVVPAYSENCERSIHFLKNSPEWSPYVSQDYIAHSDLTNGFADVYVFYADNQPVLGIPIHKSRWNHFTTGYSGLLYPPGLNERQAVRSASLLKDFFDNNKRFAFNVIHQPRGGVSKEDRERGCSIHLSLVANFSLLNSQVTRVLILEGNPLDGDDELSLFPNYQPELRNQIRKARKSGLVVDVIDSDSRAIESLINSSMGLYQSSRSRTGLQGRSAKDILTESNIVISSGFNDIWVAIKYKNELVAVVNCHKFNEKSIYNINFSSELGYKLNANPLGLDTAIRRCASSGATVFELGRFSVDAIGGKTKESAIARYKSQFGGCCVPVLSFSANVFAAAPLRIAKYLKTKTLLLNDIFFKNS